MNARQPWLVRTEGPLPARDVYAFGVIAGVIAGLALSFVMFMARLGGSALQLEQALGVWFASHGVAAFSVGFVIHLGIAGVLGAVYTYLLWRFWGRGDPFVGAAFGIVHGILVALILAIVTPFNPIPWDWTLGPFGFSEGFDVRAYAWTVFAHLIYGGLVGAMVVRPIAQGDAASRPGHRSSSRSGS